MIAAKDYEGKAVKAQLGETNNGGLQIAVDMELFDDKQVIGQMTTFLYFTEAAAPYSFERLRLLGWKGTGPADIDDKMTGIYDNKVPVRVTAPEPYIDSAGVKKMGTGKLEIVTSAGTVTLAKPLDAATFRARLQALGGGGGSSGASSGGGNAPPF